MHPSFEIESFVTKNHGLELSQWDTSRPAESGRKSRVWSTKESFSVTLLMKYIHDAATSTSAITSCADVAPGTVNMNINNAVKRMQRANTIIPPKLTNSARALTKQESSMFERLARRGATAAIMFGTW